MHIAAIIAEYDPFHQGHLYLVNKARRSGADHVIAIMSGSFMQRGGPAAFPVRLRTEMALCQGVDLVLEIPSYACCQSAEVFAETSADKVEELMNQFLNHIILFICNNKLFFAQNRI